MPSRSRSSAPAPRRRWAPEQRAAAYFGASVLVLCLTWVIGFGLRAPLWEKEIVRDRGVDIDVRQISGLSKIFPGHIPDLLNTALIIILASATYLICLWLLHKNFPRSFRAAIAATILASLSLLPSMPMTTPDSVHLAADVRTLWLHGEYPALRSSAPAQVDDPVAEKVSRFRNSPSGYGPVAYAIGGAPLPFVGDSLGGNLFGVKVVAGIFLVLTAIATGLLARRLGQNPGLATAFVGLNPLALWQFPGDGHNDSIMMFFAVLAMPLLAARPIRHKAGGLGLAALAFLAKFGVALAGPVVVASWMPPRWRKWLAATVAVLGAIAIYLFFARQESGGTGSIGPASAIIISTPWGLFRWWFDQNTDLNVWINSSAAALFIVILCYIIVTQKLDSLQDLVTVVGMTLWLYLFACSPALLPWYHIWYLPFVALSHRRWLTMGGIAFTLTSFLPTLALNWSADIPNRMGISDPVQKATAAMWIITGAVALAFYWMDRRKELAVAVASTRRTRRAPQRRPIRSRA